MLNRLNCKFHHLGLACTDLDREGRVWLNLGYRNEGPDFDDPIQKVRGRFLAGPGPRLELLAPLSADSPITSIIQRGVKIYHHAFEAPAFNEAIANFAAQTSNSPPARFRLSHSKDGEYRLSGRAEPECHRNHRGERRVLKPGSATSEYILVNDRVPVLEGAPRESPPELPENRSFGGYYLPAHRTRRAVVGCRVDNHQWWHDRSGSRCDRPPGGGAAWPVQRVQIPAKKITEPALF